MTKAVRQMREDIRLIDIIIEIIDARIPVSSRNPDIDELGKNRSRLIVMNKADLADKEENRKWAAYFKAKGFECMEADSRNRSSLKNISSYVERACAEKLQKNAAKGIKNRPLRAMVVGIPNVGKSTFINSYAGRASAKTGNKPGVTKGKQWINMGKNLELLDTPGILWPKFDDRRTGEVLAITGSVRDEILNTEELALTLINMLKTEHKGLLAARYECDEEKPDYEILSDIGKKRGCIAKGGETDTLRAAGILLDEFRNGTLGRVTLEKCTLS